MMLLQLRHPLKTITLFIFIFILFTDSTRNIMLYRFYTIHDLKQANH